MKPREWWLDTEEGDAYNTASAAKCGSPEWRATLVRVIEKSAYDEAVKLIGDLKIRWEALALCAVSPEGITYKDAIEMADKALAEIEKLHVG